MKLLLCLHCHDVFKLDITPRTCKCGRASGRYLDDFHAVYHGGIPLGFENWSLVEAIRNQPQSGMGRRFEAFVIPKDCPTMREGE